MGKNYTKSDKNYTLYKKGILLKWYQAKRLIRGRDAAQQIIT